MENVKLIICPGFIKCGTTSLYAYLSSSPVVSTAKGKELHYFSYGVRKTKLPEGLRNSVLLFEKDRSLAAYLSKFEPGEYFADISPSYLGWPDFLSNLRDLDGVEPSFIVTTRDPLKRAISSWKHAIRAGLESEKFYDAFMRDFKTRDAYTLPLKKYYQLSDYKRYMSEIVKEYGERRLLHIDFERKKSPVDVVEALNSWEGNVLDVPIPMDGMEVKKNIGRTLSERQIVLSAVLKNQRLAGFLSSIIPNNQWFRDMLKVLLYRGEGNDIDISECEIAEVKKIMIGEGFYEW